MSDQLKYENQVSNPKYLPVSWLITFVVGLCVLIPLAGALATEVGGWLGLAIWLVVWGAVFAASWIITCKYANPNIPTICGVMVGITAPRPSDEWIREFAGERWVKVTELGLVMIGVVIGLTIFHAIAKRRKS